MNDCMRCEPIETLFSRGHVISLSNFFEKLYIEIAMGTLHYPSEPTFLGVFEITDHLAQLCIMATRRAPSIGATNSGAKNHFRVFCFSKSDKNDGVMGLNISSHILLHSFSRCTDIL